MLESSVKSFKYTLISTTALFCLAITASALQAKPIVAEADNEKKLDGAIGSGIADIIRVKKESRITLTQDPSRPRKTVGIEGEIDKDKNGEIIESSRAWIDGGKKHSIRLGDKSPNLDFIRNIGFENGRGQEPDWGDDIDDKNNLGGGAFYIEGSLINGIKNSIFRHNESAKSGGAIYIAGDFIGGISHSQFKNNLAEWGGGVYVSGNFKGDIRDSVFENNHARVGGGAIYVKNTLIGNIVNSKFSNSIARSQFGGAVYANEFEGNIINSEFINTGAAWQGGAVYVERSFTGDIRTSIFSGNIGGNGAAFSSNRFVGNIVNSTFKKNEGTAGGAIYLDSSFKGNIVKTVFTENKSSTKNGGAIAFLDRLEGDISGSLFEKNISKTDGGALYVGTFKGDVEESKFIGNKAQGLGGAIYADVNWAGSINESLFEGNAAAAGGAIYINDAALEGGISTSKFIENNAEKNGGAISTFDLGGGISASEFEDNMAGEHGGAIYVENLLSGGISAGSSFHDNMADLSGGAIWVSELEDGIKKSSFSDNHAGESGGALYIDALLTGGIHESEFDNNSAGDGGAIYVVELEGGVHGSIFTDNSALGEGGAIYVEDSLKGNISNSSFINNIAEDGGALYAGDKLEGMIIDSSFRDNFANFLGGAVYAKDMMAGVDRSVFTGNAAMGWGGALYIGGICHGKISHSVFVKNHAGEAKSEKDDNPHALVGLGGAVFSYGEGSGNRIVSNSVFLGNTARSTVKGDSYGGLGGAIFHNATHDDSKVSILTIAATDHQRTIFYGNKSRRSTETQDRANAIYLGNMGKDDKKTNVNIDAGEGGVIFMFDPLEAQRDGIIDAEGEHYGELTTDLHKIGAGDWFLGGDSLMHGAATWNIDEGALRLTEVDGVQASITLEHDEESRFLLGADGIIAGTGVISARDTTLSGMLDPSSLQKTGMGIEDITDETNIVLGVRQESTYGTLSFEARDGGTVVLKDATYLVDIGEDESDLIHVKGDLEIEGGMVEVRSHVSIKDEETGFYREDRHVILKNDGKASGQFAGVHDDLAFWKTQLDYVGNEIILQFVHDQEGATDSCVTYNQCNIGEVIPDPGDGSEITGSIIDMTEEELRRAYDNLSGEIYASSRTALLSDPHLYHHLNQRLVQRSYQSENLGLSSQSALSPMWFSSFAHEGYLEANDHAARLDKSGAGIAVGLDRFDGGDVFGGFMLGTQMIQFKQGQERNARMDVNSYDISLYMGQKLGGFKLQGGVIYSLLDIKSERDIWVSGHRESLAGTLKADYYGHKLQIFGEGAHDFNLVPGLSISPYLQLSQSFLYTPAIHESYSAAALDIAAGNDSLFSTMLGIRGFYELPTYIPVRLNGDIGWWHDFGAKESTSRHSFHNTRQSFDIKGVGFERDSAFVGLGVSANLAENVSFDVGYQGRFGHDLADHSANLQLRINF